MYGWEFLPWRLLVQGVLEGFSVFFLRKCRKREEINDWILDLEIIWKFKDYDFENF